MKYTKLVLATAMLALSIQSCKKDNEETTTPVTPDECSFTVNQIIIDGVAAPFIKDICQDPGVGSYYSEHQTDTTGTNVKGLVMAFNGNIAPSAGDYTINNNILTLASGQVYIEYYATNAWIGQSGTVKVVDSGSSKVYTFCKVSCSDGSTSKVISSRATCN